MGSPSMHFSVGSVPLGAGCPLVVVGGMCVLESEDLLVEVGGARGILRPTRTWVCAQGEL